MSARLPVASLRLSEVLAPPFQLTVPAFQRPYSWTRREADQLLDDVLAASGLEAAEPETDYFLGTLLLLDTDGRGFEPSPDLTPRQFEIVDGQQRLVTLTILAAVLRDLYADVASDLAGSLDRLVAAESSPEDSGARASRVARMSLRGADGAFLADYVQQPHACLHMPADDDLSPAQERILEAREGFLARLADMPPSDARHLAEYLANHCHFVVALSCDIDHALRTFTVLNERGRPLARNDILKAELMRSLPLDRLDGLVAQWDEAAKCIGADFETFFSYVRTINGETRSPILEGIRHVIAEAGGAEAFIKRVLGPLSRAYNLIQEAIRRDGVLPEGQTRRLISLSRLTSGDWMPAAMLALAEFEDDPATVERLLADIERLAYLLRLLCTGSGRRTTRFAAVVAALRSGEALTPMPPAFELAREEVRQIAHNLKDLHRRNPAHCKLVLLRLAEEQQGEFVRLDPATLSVEHVLPQRPRAGSEWRRQFPDPAERERATHSLGNLILIGARQNERARNKDFRRKQEIYGEVPCPQAASCALEEVLSAETWTKAAIEAREARLLALLERTWRVDFGQHARDLGVADIGSAFETRDGLRPR